MLIFVLLCLLLGKASAAQLSLNVEAEAAILINADTGAVLYEKNARKLHYPASTTKIATALYAMKLKGNSLDQILTAEQEALGSTTAEAKLRSNFTLPPHWLEIDGTHIGLKNGEQMSLRDLFFGMMLASGNDAANVIAQYASGSVPQFMEGLNQYLKELGCKNSTFFNPHGLHHPRHQTTAQDMALMAQELLKDPFLAQVVATVRHTRPQTNKQEPSLLVQGNMLLRNGKYYYPPAIGIKTGYHARAGHNIVAASRKEGRTLIAVLMKEKRRPDLFQDAKKVFEAAFNQAQVKRTLVKAGLRPEKLAVKGAAKPIVTYMKEDLAITYFPAEEPKVKCLLFWESVAPPIAKGQKIGEMRARMADGSFIASVPLYAKEEVKASWSHLFKKSWVDHPFLLCGLIILGFAVFLRSYLF